MKILMSYRKCMVCGNTSENLNKDKCGCGAYMYMIGQVATPKVIIKDKRNSSQ
ncbi:MAG: hypothetical protein ACI4TK_07715 [Agathobacter sp.]